MTVIAIIGQGRIVIWEGASLWMLEGRQEAADLQPHSHHAIQITFELDGKFEIGLSGDRLCGPVAAVASDAVHTFRASGAAAFLFIAPESSQGRALSKELFADQMGSQITCGPLASSLNELRECYRRGIDRHDMERIGRKIVGALPTADELTLPDPRVLAMINFARQNLEDCVSLPSTADHVHLSHSRARHIFSAQTGLPFKSYLLWLRLEHAVSLYANGSSLTQAAHEAGFADSAHFSRTFKRTFGLPAAALRLSKSTRE